MLSLPTFLCASNFSYDFTSSFHTLKGTSNGLCFSLWSWGIFLIFLVWLQQNLLQLSDICNFVFLTDQPVPNSFSMSCTTIFFRWSGILENVRWRWSLNRWRQESFSLFKNCFPASVLLISPETGSYSILVPKLPIDDA